MGGGYYDRDMAADNGEAQNEVGYSVVAEQLLSQNKQLHKAMDPKRWQQDNLKSVHKHPIVVAIDVTGSMGEWTKVIN